jgi:hypothetical protein
MRKVEPDDETVVAHVAENMATLAQSFQRVFSQSSEGLWSPERRWRPFSGQDDVSVNLISQLDRLVC